MKYSLLLLLAMAQWVSVSAQELNMAPDFTLQDVDGATVKLADYLGKQPIMIDFWATWCNPCKVELPHLEAIYKRFKNKGLVFFAISEDSPRSISKVKPYVKTKGYTATVLLDPDGEVLRKFFAENTLPYTVIIDSAGKIARTFTGYIPGQEVEITKFVESLFHPMPPTP